MEIKEGYIPFLDSKRKAISQNMVMYDSIISFKHWNLYKRSRYIAIMMSMIYIFLI